MRDQYHSRQVGKDRHIWNVKRLIAVSRDFPVIDVPLDEISELDEEYWFGAEGSKPPTCHVIAEHFKLMQDADLNYPIILCAQGRVMDGMHRACKALAEGHSSIKAVRFTVMPAPDYMNMSLDKLPYGDDGVIL